MQLKWVGLPGGIGTNGKITMIGWSAVHRAVKVLEFKIYRISPDRWSHIFEPLFALHLMHHGPASIQYEYVRRKMSTEALGITWSMLRGPDLVGWNGFN